MCKKPSDHLPEETQSFPILSTPLCSTLKQLRESYGFHLRYHQGWRYRRFRTSSSSWWLTGQRGKRESLALMLNREKTKSFLEIALWWCHNAANPSILCIIIWIKTKHGVPYFPWRSVSYKCFSQYFLFSLPPSSPEKLEFFFFIPVTTFRRKIIRKSFSLQTSGKQWPSHHFLLLPSGKGCLSNHSVKTKLVEKCRSQISREKLSILLPAMCLFT